MRRIVEIDGLTKCFDRKGAPPFTAVNGISFAIEAGERVAFIGPNGAGKSTTLKMLTGILTPTAGRALVADFVPWESRTRLAREIGIVFGQRSQLWTHLPVRESFTILGKIYGVADDVAARRVGSIAETLRIGDLMDQSVRSLSLGQRMRCEIAASLVHAPQILFLDEPTIGLDVTARALLREHLKSLSGSSGTTIVLTSHDTGDIEEICDRVILVNHGKIMIDRPLAVLRADFDRRRQIGFVTDEECPSADFGAGVEVVERAPHRLTLSVDTSVMPVERLVSLALSAFTIQDLSIDNAPLERIIMDLYGEHR